LSVIYPIAIWEIFTVISQAISKSHPSLPNIIEKKMNFVIMILIIWETVFILLAFIICIFISHRIAGPMYKLQQYLSDIKEGKEQGDLHFRKGDYFREIASSVNETFNAIRERNAKDFAYLDEIGNYLDKVADKIPHEDQAKLFDIKGKLECIQSRFNLR